MADIRSLDWSDTIPIRGRGTAPPPQDGRLDVSVGESIDRLDRSVAPGGIPKDLGRAFEAYRAWIQEALNLPRDVAYLVAWGSIGGAAWWAWRAFRG